MASIMTDLAKTVLEKLMNNAIAESRYICCFTCIAEDMKKGKEALKAKRATMEEHVKVANRRAEGIQSDVIFWQKQVDKLIQEEDAETNMTSCFGLCPNCKKRYCKGKDMANKIEEMRGLMERNYESVGLPPNLPDVEYHSLRDYISFESRELQYKQLMDALKDDNIYMVGLQGMGGTGKTTLAKKVGKELKQSKLFDHVIDTTVSYTPDTKKIQDDIAAPLGVKLENCSESERHKLLWTRLIGGEKILLILDDVWRDINFEEIGIPYNDNRKGCRVLLTTRDRSVCDSMECERIIQLGVLPDEDAWILFKKHAGITGSSSKSLLEKGRKIVKKCKGLPIAIAAIASSLKGKQQEEEWVVALKSLQKHVPMHGVDKNLVQVYQCLSYSYDNLKNEEAKRLFLLCSLFHEDELLSVEILTRFGIGAGLFGEVHTYDDARSQVVVAINELIYSCLLLQDKKGFVKMHDLIRDVALWIANKEIQLINLSKENKNLLVEGKQNIKYLLCECKDMDVFSYRFDGSKLEILIAYMDGGDVEAPNSFFENMNGLRVLYLSKKNWKYSRQSLSLSQSIQSLTNIRSLFLEGLKLGDISFIGTLHSLETFDLHWCDMDELTSEITKLEKLKLLRLLICHTLKNDSIFEVIEKCSSLEELYIIGHSNFSGAPQRRNLPAFQRYYLSESYFSEMKYSISKYVDLSKVDVFFSEATFKYLVQTAESLHLTEIKGEWRNLIPNIVPGDNGMNDLVKLKLRSCSKLQCLIDTGQNVFSKLTTLELEEMEELEELCSGPFPSEFLKSLETLEIGKCSHLRSILFKSELNLCYLKFVELSECPKLISLFQLSTSRSLVLLEDLFIQNCEQLKNIITDERTGDEPGEEIDDGGDDIKQCGSMFPNLKTLRIGSCPQLKFIFHFLSPQDFPKLKAISINDCDKLEYIFVQYKHELEDHELHHEVMNVTLCSLNRIDLYNLPIFIDIFPDCHHPVHLSMKKSSSKAQIQPVHFKCNVFPWTHICCYACKCRDKLRSTEIPLVSKDQQLDYSISSASNSNYLQLRKIAQCLSKQTQILRNIKAIYLSGISKIKSVFVLSDAPTLLVETLDIGYCDELKHIIIDIGDERGGKSWGDVFPKLKDLRVRGCKQLEYIFGYYPHGNYQNHNDIIQLHLPVLECLVFDCLPSLIGICPDNYHITVAPSKNFQLLECSHFISKSISDFFFQLEPRQLDGTNTKGSKHVLTVERIQVGDQPHVTYIFEGLKNSITLQNLTKLRIARCDRLEVIISTSILRSLPQLYLLMIEECKELKQIIEEDDVDKSNILSLKTCFPKLKAIMVIKCNKLKCIFPASTSRELPKLEILMIKEATVLEEVFKCKQSDRRVELPNLKFVLLVKLPSLCHDLESLTAEHRFVQNCPTFSMTSTCTYNRLTEIGEEEYFREDHDLYWSFVCLRFMERTAEAVEDLPTTSGCESTFSQELLNEQPTGEPCLMNEQQLLGETNITSIIPQGNKCLKEIEDQSVQESVSSKKTAIETLSLESETRSTSLGPLQKGIKRSSEERTTSTANAHGHGDGQIAMPSSALVATTSDPPSNKVVDTQETCELVEEFTVLEIPSSPTKSANAKTSPLDTPLHETISHELQNEQTIGEPCLRNERQLLGETNITSIILKGNKCLKEIECRSIEESPTSKKTVTATLLMESETRNTSLEPLQKGIKRSAEEGTTSSAKAKSLTLSTNLESVSSSLGPLVTSEGETHPPEHGDGQIATPSSVLAVTTTEPPSTKNVDTQETSDLVIAFTKSRALVSLNDDASMRVSSIVEELFSTKDGIGVSESKPSPTNTINSPIASKCLLVPFEGNPSQMVDDSSFASLVTRELEQLVSNKHLASENLSLLIDFLMKHPCVRLTDNALSNRYKGCAYTSLAELLKFLQTRSVLDVLGSSHSVFAELLQDVHSFGFDKDWLDDVEQQVLFPGLQVSQDAMQKVLDSKQTAIKEVEMLRLKISILSQHVEDLKHQLVSSEAVLERINQQEAQILEAWTALHAPIGY